MSPLKCTDQIGQPLALNRLPERIVSLVPSITLTLYDLGLDEHVVGRTKFCVHPADRVSSAEVVGGTKKFHIDRIRRLQPDLILANKEENDEGLVRQLQEEFPVYVSDVRDLNASYEMTEAVGYLTGTEEKAKAIVKSTAEAFETLGGLPGRTAAYFIWKGPWMVAGSDTFIDDLLQRCQLNNVFAGQEGRYPEVSEQQLQSAGPELILLSSEPYPFKEEHLSHMQELSPNAAVLLVDGEYFSWYGSRLTGSPKYFLRMLRRET